MYRRLLVLSAITLLICSSSPPSSASSTASKVSREGTILFGGHEEAILGFAWDGEPQPLSRGIEAKELVARRQGDRTLIVMVAASSCSTWQAEVDGGSTKRLRMRFADSSGKALVLGDGNAIAGAVGCVNQGTKIAFEVPEIYHIGMGH